jgi:hypothetical protein
VNEQDSYAYFGSAFALTCGLGLFLFLAYLLSLFFRRGSIERCVKVGRYQRTLSFRRSERGDAARPQPHVSQRGLLKGGRIGAFHAEAYFATENASTISSGI